MKAATHMHANQPADKLHEALAQLSLSERQWTITDLRFGFTKKHSLREISAQLQGLSPEYIRQLQAKSIVKCHHGIQHAAPACTVLDQHAMTFAAETPMDTIIAACQSVFTNAGWRYPSAQDIQRLLFIPRAIGWHSAKSPQTSWPALWTFACTLPPVILAPSRVQDPSA